MFPCVDVETSLALIGALWADTVPTLKAALEALLSRFRQVLLLSAE